MKGELSSAAGVVPLRTILRNFLNLVENCESKRNGGLDSYDKEFQELKLFSESLKSDSGYMCKEGEKPVNRKKNRYKDILPFDYTRVILSDYGEIPGSDYINANFIKGASGSSAYIACQGPLPHTVNDFWRMVVECEVQVIVMACNEQESGKHKCENYWVEENGVERQFGEVTIWLKKCRSVCPDFLVRTMRIRFVNAAGEKEERNVCQFHYSAWPDHGVPTKVRPLLDMVRLIRDCQTSETLPVLVHCSAGCGRTGTICAIDYVWGLLRLGKLTPDFSLYHLVRDMRRQRIAMVQTKDQYILVHRAVRELFQEQLKIIEAHPYANVDQNGLPLEIKAELQEPTYETIDYRHRDTSGMKKPPELHSIGKSSAQDVIAADSGLSDSTSTALSLTASPPPPPPNPKLMKEVENHQKLQEQMRSREPEPLNEIQRAISPVVTISKSCADESKPQQSEPQTSINTSVQKPSVSSSSKSSLLRKPSIIKLKAFFEKSKDDKDKKSGAILLSRAKSDVSSSSRFYTQNSKTNSVSPTTSDKPTIQPVKVDKPESASTHRKYLGLTKPKPILLAKPTLPVKRSKSLKSHPTDSSFTNGSETKDLIKESRCGDTSSHASPNKSTSTVVSPDPKNPIRVCVKQVEMPKLQKVVSKSIKLAAQQAKTTDKPTIYPLECQRNSSSQSGTSGSTSSQSTMQKEPSKRYEEVKEKPQVPLRTNAQSLKVNHNYSNVSYGTNRIKMGLAKEMEDARDYGVNSNAVKLCKMKKYETVNPKSIASGRTALTRSHSHVWQSDKVSLPMRIFSDENIHQTGNDSSHLVNPFQVNESTSRHSTKRAELGNHKYSASESFFDSLFNKSSIQNSPNSSFAKFETKNQVGEKPIIRRSVPKTNPYTNYPSGSPNRNSKVLDSNDASLRFSDVSSDSPLKECVPRLKSSHGNSVGNSSDSSSNAGTPRNSLPSTPTQSIDLLYSQLNRNNAISGNDSNLPAVGHPRGTISSNGPPKSILKGSLSSTPSESDEKLDSNRPNLIPNTNPLFSPPKLNTIRIAVGIRERRNSFRQAVWKEEQGNSPPKSNSVQPFSSVNTYPSTSTSSSAHLQNGYIKTHKDYEPIWPDSSNAHAPFRLGNSKISDSNLRGPPPSNNQLQHPINHSNDGRSKPIHEPSMGNSNYTPKMKSRVEEIKVLLEELKAPGNGAGGGTETNNYVSRNQFKPTNAVAGTSLKHQRSLRVPSKPQYQQGLSCFTFKKPSSYESITDHLQAEEYQPLVKPPSSVFYNGNQNSQPEERLSSTAMESRQGNDYVVLGQCRTQSSSNGREMSPIRSFGPSNSNHSLIPVPPPRTKRQQSSSPKRNGFEEEIRAAPLTVWMGSQTGISTAGPGAAIEEKDNGAAKTDSRNMTGEMQEDTRGAEMPINSASPKAIIKALGLFQAKAANVRSRFINWTEAKDRQGKKPEHNNDMPIVDYERDSNNEQNFEHSSQPGPQAGPSWSKHQYL